ncbi:hypothetical protein H5410_004440 [Solanum commersonii]|uniref:Uncharacterized protein n=1 Tax=Solanum commersonii TaxID=4109 RepID=A0A9J6B7Z2_SOLCO|nr:hypothetical protein H5410_004440 [Solanum commersonii]
MSHFFEIHCSIDLVKIEILNLSRHGFREILESTLAVKDKLLFTRGLQGELNVKYLDKLGVFFCSRRPKSRMSLPLLLRLKKTVGGALHFIASNNDSRFQHVDLGGFDSDVDELQGIDLDDFDLDIDEFLCIDLGDFNSDVHEYDYMNKRMQDISVVEVRNDKGIQWIPKERLRNLVWAPSKCDVYLMSHFSIIDWSSLACAKTEILNLSWDVAPLENHPESFLEELKET